MPTNTTRLALAQPAGTDGPSEFRIADTANTNTLDNAVLVTEGTLAARPSAATVEKDHVYKATDLNQWYISDGTNWNSFDVYGAGGAVSRGAVSITASQSTSSTTYTTLGTPDQVTGIVLPTNGLIAVWYQATWQSSVADAAQAAIFLGSNQIKAQTTSSLPGVQAAATSGANASVNHTLVSCPIGLASASGSQGGADVTTGQVVGIGAANANDQWYYNIGGGAAMEITGTPIGGPCYIFAAAGTYTVSVQFKATSGSVTASNRQLWVQAFPFA